jgi:hypothetical protein
MGLGMVDHVGRLPITTPQTGVPLIICAPIQNWATSPDFLFSSFMRSHIHDWTKWPKDTKILGENRYLPARPTCKPPKRRRSASSVLHKTTLKIAGCWRRCTSKIRIEGIQHPDKEYKFAPSCVSCCTPARRLCFACNWTVCSATTLDSIASHSPLLFLPVNKVTCVYYLSYSSASWPAPAF